LGRSGLRGGLADFLEEHHIIGGAELGATCGGRYSLTPILGETHKYRALLTLAEVLKVRASRPTG
jgi:hypothetical protein